MNAPALQIPAECQLADPARLLVGVSGGADSLCLADLLLRSGHSITVAHFDHQLRPTSGRDAEAVRTFAAEQGVPFAIGAGDVRAFAARTGRSIEDAARVLRYQFLFEKAREHRSEAVAVGHTADDQVETVLLHLLRGAGLNGLAGMSFRTVLSQFDETIPLLRPLLNTTHQQALDYCKTRGLVPVTDESNASLEYRRNRVRHELIPQLETYNPNVRGAIARMARLLDRDRALLGEAVEESWQATVGLVTESEVVFDAGRLAALPPALLARILRRAVSVLDPTVDVDFAAIARASGLVRQLAAGSVDLKGGLRMWSATGRITISNADAPSPPPDSPQLPEGLDTIRLDGTREVTFGDRWILTSKEVPLDVTERGAVMPTLHPLENAGAYSAWFDADLLPIELELRVRRPGDRFEPLGMSGHTQKLSNFMVNQKIPRATRERWPILCSGSLVLWVPGYRPAHSHRLTAESSRAVQFRLRRLTDR